MSKTKTRKAPLENAEEIIDRFGGIRPAATKLGAAVTTVQGWKDRGRIPAARRQEILDAAAENGIDLSDLFGEAEPVSAVLEPEPELEPEPVVLTPEKPAAPPYRERLREESREGARSEKAFDKNIMDEINAVQGQAVAQSSWISAIFVILAVGAGAYILWPAKQTLDNHQAALARLESEVETLNGRVGQVEGEVDVIEEERSSFLGGLIPESVEQRYSELKEQSRAVQEELGAMIKRAEEVGLGAGVIGADDGSFEARVARLEEQMEALGGSPEFAGLVGRINLFRGSVAGEAQIDAAFDTLKEIAGGSADLESDLAQLREEKDGALGQMIEGVDNEDLQAAAMLIGFSKFRRTLNRDGKPFEDDLQVLLKIVPEENTALRGALVRLAPHAQSGVLTPEGLSKEFKTLAGDAVMASLQGEDVSIKDKAKARLNEVLQVSKDGELVTGTDTQAKVAKVDHLLEQGDIASALGELEQMSGPEADLLKPFMAKAQETMQVQDARQMIDLFLAGGILPGGQMVRDPASGVSIYKPAGISLPAGLEDAVSAAGGPDGE